MVKNIEAWEQQPHESNKAYERFKIYLNLPRTERTYKKVHTELTKIIQKIPKSSENSKKYGKIPTESAIEKTGRKWNWIERAKLYDMDQDFKEQLANEEEFKEENQKWQKLWKETLKFANKLLTRIMENNDEYKLTTQMSLFNSLVSLLDKLHRNFRLSYGRSTSITEQTGKVENEVTVNDGDDDGNKKELSDKELEELLTINDEEENFTDEL